MNSIFFSCLPFPLFTLQRRIPCNVSVCIVFVCEWIDDVLRRLAEEGEDDREINNGHIFTLCFSLTCTFLFMCEDDFMER